MNLRRLRHAVALAEHGSYVRAARALHLSPSALSRSIQAIEAEFGQALFFRGRHGARVTPAGKRFIAAAAGLLQSAHEFEQTALSARHQPAEVSFGIGPLPAVVLLHEVFQAALKATDRRLQIEILSGHKLLERLNATAIEFFVCGEGVAPRVPHVMVEHIATWELGCFARRGHPLARKSKISAIELQDYPMVGGFSYDRLGASDPGRLPHDPLIACDDYHLLSATLRHSDAVCTFPLSFATSGLVRLDCAEGVIPDQVRIVLCQPRSTPLTEAANITIDDIRLAARRMEHRLAP